MKQFNCRTLLVLALIVTANGCRTTDGSRWRSLSFGRNREISADAQSIADSELPPPSAAVLPGRPLLGKAKAITSDATKSVTNSVKKATEKVRNTTKDVGDVVEQAATYPATAYPQFQTNSTDSKDTPLNVPAGLATTNMPTPNIPNLRAPDISVKQPTAQVALPEVPSSIRTASANLSAPNSSPTTSLATGTSAGSNYATGPYSTSATTIPSQTLKSQNDSATAATQQGFYNPQHMPTTSSRRSTLPAVGGPNYQIPESTPTNTLPASDATSSLPGTNYPSNYPSTGNQPYPTTPASAISQVSGTASVGVTTNHAVEPATFNASPSNPPTSFYSQPGQQPSSWRPGSTSQGSLASPIQPNTAQPTNALDAAGCNNGVCTVPQGTPQSTQAMMQPATHQQPVASQQAATYQQPTTYQQPGYQQPNYQQPNYQQPGFQQPGYQQPGYQQPSAEPHSPQTTYQTAQPQVMNVDNRDSTWR